MIIKTKFNVGEYAIVINNNHIHEYPIIKIEFHSNTVYYTFLVSKAPTMLDKDVHVVRDETQCFKNFNQLVNRYKMKK